MKFLRQSWPRLLFVLITAVAFSLRFWNLKELPCGLFPDQALSGLEVIRGKLLPYYSFYGEHDEGIFIALLYFLSKVMGIGQWQIFALSALIGSLTIPLCLLVVKRLHGWPVALLTGVFLATSPWHIALSRNGLRAVIVPIFLLLALWLAAELKETSSRRGLKTALLGFVLGLGFYSYSSYRAVLFILVPLGILLWKKGPRLVLTTTAIIALSLVPLGLSFLRHPQELYSRASQISVFNNPKAPAAVLIADNLKGVALSLSGIVGDTSWRNDLAQSPMLLPGLVLFLALGLIVSLKKASSGHLLSGLYVLGFFAFLLPAVLAYDTPPPHLMRLVGEIPFVFLLTALGIEAVSKKVRLPHLLPWVAMLALIPLYFYSSSTLAQSENNPIFASDFRCDLAEVAQSIKDSSPSDKQTFVVGTEFDRLPLDLYLQGMGVKIKNLDSTTITYQEVSSSDLVIAPVYGDLGFYHLDHLDTLNDIPWGGNQFLKALTTRYPDLKITSVHTSDHPRRYSQGISFITLVRP